MLASPPHDTTDNRDSHFRKPSTRSHKKPQWTYRPSDITVVTSAKSADGRRANSTEGGALNASAGTVRTNTAPQASLPDWPLPLGAQPLHLRSLPPDRAAAGPPPLPPPTPGRRISPIAPAGRHTGREAAPSAHDVDTGTTSTAEPIATATQLLPTPSDNLSPTKQDNPRSRARHGSASAGRPAIAHRLRSRSQSQSHTIPVSEPIEPLPRISPAATKTQHQGTRSRRSGVSGGFLVGLGGYDATEYKQYTLQSPATPTRPDTEMAPSVRIPGKQKNASGSGSSLIFGPPRTGTGSSMVSMASASTGSSGAVNHSAGIGHPANETLSIGSGRLRAASLSTAGTGGTPITPSPLNPFPSNIMTPKAPVFKHEGGRRWLRDPDLPYPLPVDVEELHRQSLRLVMMMRLFGAPFLNKQFLASATPNQADPESPARRKSIGVDNKINQSCAKASPRRKTHHSLSGTGEKRQLRVLEVGCGSGIWSSACHDYLTRKGLGSVHFTGMDIAPLAPDLRKQGVNWRFVQWDARHLPWPFADAEFDMIFIKDCGMLLRSVDTSPSSPMPEAKRMLRPGGVVEIWESDHVFRTLLPSPKLPPGTPAEEAHQAACAGAHVINASTPFAPAQNRFLSDLNAWMTAAFNERDLPPTPCGLAEWAIRADVDVFTSVESFRVALPFDETRWEKQMGKQLTDAQKGLRRTALLTTLQLASAMEPMLRAASGKRQDEWNRWWSAGMRDLLEDKGAAGGESLELGAFWATRAG